MKRKLLDWLAYTILTIAGTFLLVMMVSGFAEQHKFSWLQSMVIVFVIIGSLVAVIWAALRVSQ